MANCLTGPETRFGPDLLAYDTRSSPQVSVHDKTRMAILSILSIVSPSPPGTHGDHRADTHSEDAKAEGRAADNARVAVPPAEQDGRSHEMAGQVGEGWTRRWR